MTGVRPVFILTAEGAVVSAGDIVIRRWLVRVDRGPTYVWNKHPTRKLAVRRLPLSGTTCQWVLLGPRTTITRPKAEPTPLT